MDQPAENSPAASAPAGGTDAEPRRRRSRGGRGRRKPEGGAPLVTDPIEAKPEDWKPGEGRRERPRREAPEGRAPQEGREKREERDRGRGRDASRERGGRGRREESPKLTDEKPKDKPAAVPQKKENFLEELGGDLLQGVSRSFFLTIKLLPEPLRAPISLGYLLARTMDTIADAAPAAKAADRLEHLRAFAVMVKYGPNAEAFTRLKKEITSRLPASAERTLLESAPRLIAWLEHIARDDQWELRRVLGRIAYGQELDLARFGDGTSGIVALQTVADLDDYTYFVAGSVGEFWTRLSTRHLGANFARLSEKEMLPLGKRYGQGLQLINILRDLREDLSSGRCYLPLEELTAAGLTPEDLTKHPAKARKLVRKWRAEAVARLDDGWKYVQAIGEWKLRYPVAMPILIGLDTLKLLAKEPPLEASAKMKVKRSETASTLLKAKLGVISQKWLDGMYARRRKRANA